MVLKFRKLENRADIS